MKLVEIADRFGNLSIEDNYKNSIQSMLDSVQVTLGFQNSISRETQSRKPICCDYVFVMMRMTSERIESYNKLRLQAEKLEERSRENKFSKEQAQEISEVAHLIIEMANKQAEKCRETIVRLKDQLGTRKFLKPKIERVKN